jgi:hypothetical protein
LPWPTRSARCELCTVCVKIVCGVCHLMLSNPCCLSPKGSKLKSMERELAEMKDAFKSLQNFIMTSSAGTTHTVCCASSVVHQVVCN